MLAFFAIGISLLIVFSFSGLNSDRRLRFIGRGRNTTDQGEYLLFYKDICSKGSSQVPDSPTNEPTDEITLYISQPGHSNGLPGTSYAFEFEDDDIPSSVTEVLFTWAFGDGTTGSARATVVDGRARINSTKSYSTDGAYGLVADVKNGNAVVTKKAVIVLIGQDRSRSSTLTSCDGWSAAQSGGTVATTDNWDITAIPAGAVFDFDFE